MANYGWISDFKMSMEASGQDASNCHFRIFKNQKFFFVEIQLPFICHFNKEGAEGPQNGPKGRWGPKGPPSPP